MTRAGAGEPLAVEVGWAGAALEGNASGDVHVVAGFPGGALVAVLDGLGHGVEAAEAALAAARIIEAAPEDPIPTLIERCHVALHHRRGAVLTLASFDARRDTMTWAGIGNVDAVLLRSGARAGGARETIALRGGIVGYQLPSVHADVLSVARGDTLVIATDGIRGGFTEGVFLNDPPQAIADAILARHARDNDDSLVLVARYLGGRP